MNPAERQINYPPQQRQQYIVIAVESMAFIYFMVQCLVPNHRFIKCVFKCSSSDVIKYWLVDSSYKYTITRSSATAKSTARPSCLVGVLYDISRQRIC